MEIQATNESANLRQLKPKLQANRTYNAATSLVLDGAFIRRTTDLEKAVNMNWLFLAFGNLKRRRVLV